MDECYTCRDPSAASPEGGSYDLSEANLRQLGIGDAVLQRIQHSLSVITEALNRYSPEELVLAYNGGKDSVVLIYLIHAAYQLRFGNKRPKLITIYFNLPNSFIEVKDFMLLSATLYNLDVIWLDKSFKDGLHDLVTVTNEADGTTCFGRKPLRAVFMGTRRSDPGGSSGMKEFAPTDAGWPQIMRVNAILDWEYHEVWEFLRCLNLKYCILYDKGYTSIGNTDDTVPNEKLHNPESGCYSPAHELKDGSLERAGRRKKIREAQQQQQQQQQTTNTTTANNNS